MELNSLSVILMLISFFGAERAKEQDKPDLRVRPSGPEIFRGENVTLWCLNSGQNGAIYYRYDWEKDEKLSYSSNLNYFETNIEIYQTAKYRCCCFDTRIQTYCGCSDYVSLKGIERPKALLILHSTGQIFSGETVTLTCHINGHTATEWRYSWYKDDDKGNPVYSSDEENEYLLRTTLDNNGKYSCRGARKSDSQISGISDAVTLTVSALPRATLTAELDSPVFTGESVTLKCEVSGYYGWRYEWYKEKLDQMSVVDQSEIYTLDRDTLTIRGDAVFNGDKYRCRGGKRDRPTSSQLSNSFTLTVKDFPKATLTVEPRWSPVFSGESVTLKCEIESYSNWRYQWYKSSSRTVVSQTPLNTFTFTSSAADQDQYWCRGERDNRPTLSKDSNRVDLSVKEPPKPELTSSLKGAALIGNPVTLYCILDQSAGWRFYWSKRTQTPETETFTDTHSYTIRPVSVSDGGHYWCRAGRGDPVFYTHYSDALWVNVTGTSSPVSLIVSPSRSQHFSDDSLSLLCEGQSNSTGWRVRQYTNSKVMSDCLSSWRSVSASICNINSLSTSHTGDYWCESESGGSSNLVNITVHNGDVILESPVHPVTEGGPLTLRCLYRYRKLTELTADFYKDGLLIHNQTTGEMTIPIVSKSDEGLYYCKLPEKGKSPLSWISVRVSKGFPTELNLTLVGLCVGVSLILLFIAVFLILLWFYKTNKGNTQNTSQTQSDQRESEAEDSFSGNTSRGAESDHIYETVKQADDDAADKSSDVTYSEIIINQKKPKNKGGNVPAKPSQTETIYSKLHPSPNKPTDSGAGSSEVTYAEIELKMKPKTKKGHVSGLDESAYVIN